jgi:hypothetical protein
MAAPATQNPAPAPATATPDALLASLRREPPLADAFHEVRYRRALKAPLVTAGTLHWRGGMDFERRVGSPYRETSRLDGRTLVVSRPNAPERIIPLARAPELQVLFGALSALFAGDAAAVARAFETALEGGDAAWRLRLVPRQAQLRERIEALELHGHGDEAACLVLRQPDAATLTVFGDTAPATDAPDLDALIARTCPMP